MSGEFWLADRPWQRSAPLLPNKPRGVPRAGDRRGISGIVHVLRPGGRWIDAPANYGSRKRLYHRFVQWAGRGVWVRLFQALAAAGGLPAELLLGSTPVRAHRCATGGKGSRRSRRPASAGAAAPPKSRL
jgi:transposase